MSKNRQIHSIEGTFSRKL